MNNNDDSWLAIAQRTKQNLFAGGWLQNTITGIATTFLGVTLAIYMTGKQNAILAAGAFTNILLWIFVYNLYISAKESPSNETKTETNPPSLPGPTFRASDEHVSLMLGNQGHKMTRAHLLAGYTPLKIGQYEPLKIYTKDNKLYADVLILGGYNKINAEIKENKFSVRNPHWDYNSNDKVLEIVDEKQRPVFQLIYKDETRVIINGIFPAGPDFIYYAKEGFSTNSPKPLTQAEFNLKPIFKYPSWKYQGQYVD